jgi:hypothetical protein
MSDAGPTVVEVRLFRSAGFFLCGVLGRHWARRGSSAGCLLASQISHSSLAFHPYPVLLSHGMSIDSKTNKRNRQLKPIRSCLH